MTRNPASERKPYAPQRVLHSTSGNAHFDNTQYLPSQTTSGFSNTSVDQGSPQGGPCPLVPLEIQDRKGKVHYIWKKLTSDGAPDEIQDQILISAGGYLEPCEIEDRHGVKHYGYKRSGLLTNAELQSPKYVAYRNRARKDVNDQGEQVWSDELEEAFQLAIRIIRPMAPKKRQNDRNNGSKSKGRNELISEKIHELTGKIRSRKKVSSHIQVLKNLMKKGSPWLSLVTYDEKANTENKPVYQYCDELKNGRSSSYLQSQLHVGDVKSREGSGIPTLLRSDGLHDPYDLSRSPSIQHIELGMHIYAAATTEIIHTYTTIQSEMGAQSKSLEDVLDWRSIYPDLAKLYQAHGQLNSEIFLVEANFKLMDDLPPGKSRLGIHLFAEVACDVSYMEWNYTTKFYEKGQFRLECSESLKSHTTPKSRGVRLEIPFKSSWWRDVFHNISRQRHKVMATGSAQDVQQDEENARRYLREMTVMQEIHGKCLYDREPRRVAILLWKFRQTRCNETGTTTWRRLHGATITSPTPVVFQPPLRLESAILDGHDYNHNLPTTQSQIQSWENMDHSELDYLNGSVTSGTTDTETVIKNLSDKNHSMRFSKNSNQITGLMHEASSQPRQGSRDPSLVTGFILNSNLGQGASMKKESPSDASLLALEYNRPGLEYRSQNTTAVSSSLPQEGAPSGPIDIFASICSTERNDGFDSQSPANMYNTYDFESQEDPNICITGERETQSSTMCRGPEDANQGNTDSHDHDFTGGEIHLRFDVGSDLSVYDPALLAPATDMDPQYQHQSYLFPEYGQEQSHEQDHPPPGYDAGQPSYLSPDHNQEHQPYHPPDHHNSGSFLTRYHQPHTQNSEQQHLSDSQDSQQQSGIHFDSSWDTLGILSGHFLGVADAFEQAGLSLAEDSALHSWDIIDFPEALGVEGRQEEQQHGLILGEVPTDEDGGGMEGLERLDGLEFLDGKGGKEEGLAGV